MAGALGGTFLEHLMGKSTRVRRWVREHSYPNPNILSKERAFVLRIHGWKKRNPLKSTHPLPNQRPAYYKSFIDLLRLVIIILIILLAIPNLLRKSSLLHKFPIHPSLCQRSRSTIMLSSFLHRGYRRMK